jgi:hypothetical protein
MFLSLNDVNSSEDRMIKPCGTGLDDRIFLKAMVGRGGLEPPTSRLSGVRSNHLSYRPISRHAEAGGLVEPIGIEPMTS